MSYLADLVHLLLPVIDELHTLLQAAQVLQAALMTNQIVPSSLRNLGVLFDLDLIILLPIDTLRLAFCIFNLLVLTFFFNLLLFKFGLFDFLYCSWLSCSCLIFYFVNFVFKVNIIIAVTPL